MAISMSSSCDSQRMHSRDWRSLQSAKAFERTVRCRATGRTRYAVRRAVKRIQGRQNEACICAAASTHPQSSHRRV